MDNYFKNLTIKDDIFFTAGSNPVFYPIAGNKVFNNIEENSFWYRHRNNCILKIIELFKPKGAIFEIGGGNGYVSKAIVDKGFDIGLIEPDYYGVLNAKKRH